MATTTAREVLPRGLLFLLGAAASVIVLSGVRAVSGIIGPSFLALVLTVLVHPVRAWLRAHRVPGWGAMILCLLLVYGLLLGLGLALVVATGRFAALLPTYQDDLQRVVGNVEQTLSDLGMSTHQLQDLSSSMDFSQLANLALGVAGGIADVASGLVFIVTLVLFMTLDAGAFPDNLASAGADRPGIVAGFQSFASGTRTYLLVSTVFGFIVAVIDTGALALLGIPIPLVWGLLAFITNYIPNIGFVIGLVPPAVLALLEGGPGLMLAVIAAYCVINFILQSVIQPKFVGDAVGLSTSITFLSLVFWAFLLGALGALLAIPLTLLVKAVLIESDPRNAWLGPLLSNKPSQLTRGS